MKKIFLIVGLAFGCSSVYAQVTIQTGFDNTIDRSGKTATNPLTVSNIRQYQGNQTAKVQQGADINVPGQENITNVFQKNVGATSPSLGNFVTIMQAGGTNLIEASQLGKNNFANLSQAVGTASSTLQTFQSGERNLIVAAQNSGSFNKAFIVQGRIFNAADNALDLTTRNTARLQQSGQASVAEITQSGSAGLFIGVQKGGGLFFNKTVVTQSNNGGFDADQDGDNNNIKSTQEGNQYATAMQGTTTINGEITINQGSAATDDTRNTAYVKQTAGNSNVATVTQTAITAEQNLARINQAGTRRGAADKSTATVIQSGKSSLAEIDQLAGGTFNKATVTQTLSQIKKGNYAGLSQSGEENTFTAEQKGNTNVIGLQPVAVAAAGAKAVQSGQKGTATLIQDGQSNSIGMSQQGASNTIAVTQYNDLASGIGNKATANQAAPTASSKITINQTVAGVLTTDENVATVDQNKGNLNEAKITQDKKNEAIITQEGTDDAGTASTVTIDQQATTSGYAKVTQSDGTQGGVVFVQQRKIGNKATVNQTAGRQNNAQVYQSEDGNEALVDQSGTFDAGTGTFSTVTITQNGKKGYAKVTQEADGSVVDVKQENSKAKNSAIITQKGRAQDAGTYQAGDLSETTIKQESGASNVARTIQTNLLNTASAANGEANHRAELTQTGTLNNAVIGQGGLMNKGYVTQNGDKGFASTLQNGVKNTSTTNQTSLETNNTANVAQVKILNPGSAAVGAIFGDRATRNAITLATNLPGNALGAQTVNDIADARENTATINQTAGQNQAADLYQSGDFEKATINQSGTDNTNVAIQGGEKDVLTSTQSGTFSTVAVSQYGVSNAKFNNAEIIQSGTKNAIDLAQIKYGNQAKLTQSGSDNNALGIVARQIGENNTLTAVQSGNQGSMIVTQGLQGAVVVGFPNVFTYAQTFSVIANEAYDNTATPTQKGLNNIIGIAQQGDKGKATIDQDGHDNNAAINQTNVLATRSKENEAWIIQGPNVANSTVVVNQTGSFNKALDVTQTGNGATNTIALEQANDNNEAILSQNTGTNNLIRVIQATTNPGTTGGYAKVTQTSGSDNKARVRQEGLENKLTLTQTGNSNILQDVNANPASFALQDGQNNEALLSQTGNGHIINLGQGGKDNYTKITQSSL